MKRLARLLICTAVVSGGLAIPVTSAFGTTPPGQQGYEGQPGNQGGGGGQPPGLLGYEGQPGNQGGHWRPASHGQVSALSRGGPHFYLACLRAGVWPASSQKPK